MALVIVVLQMGKVGSKTIVETFKFAKPGMVVEDLSVAGLSGDSIVHSHSIEDVQNFLATIDPDGVETLIISAVRDPLRQSVSNFFQNFDNPNYQHSDDPYLYLATADEILRMPTIEIVEHFQQQVSIPFSRIQESFMKSFCDVIEQNHSSLEFSDSGVATGKFSRGAYAIMRMHRFGDAFSAVGQLIGLDGIEVRSVHFGHEKWYGEKYKEFLQLYKPSDEELVTYYDSEYAHAYFPEGDLENFQAEWAVGASASA